MLYEVIQTGSDGNSILYNGNILLDCGIPYSKIKPYLKQISLVLLTHAHADHFLKSTIRRLAIERPALRFACGEWLQPLLEDCGVKNIDVLEMNEVYDYGICKISPFSLYHDVPNCGWRIFLNNGERVFHATDTNTLEGLSAVGYDYYFIEANFDEEQILVDIAEKMALGKFAYEIGAMNSHLSFQKSQAFVDENAIGTHTFVKLHMSKRYL